MPADHQGCRGASVCVCAEPENEKTRRSSEVEDLREAQKKGFDHVDEIFRSKSLPR